MKNTTKIFGCLLFSLLLMASSLLGQSSSINEVLLNKKIQVQSNLEDYISQKMQGDEHQQKHSYLMQEMRKNPHNENNNIKSAANAVLKEQYLVEYFNINKNDKVILSQALGNGSMCDGGDFEGGVGDLAFYNLTHTQWGWQLCTNCGGSLCAPPALNPNANETQITNNNTDNYGIQDAHSGNHGIRINGPQADYYIDNLNKCFTKAVGEDIFSFWYAVVLEHPDNHDNGSNNPGAWQPYFQYSVTGPGVNVNVCQVSDPTNLFWQEDAANDLVYRDWSCVQVDISNVPVGGIINFDFLVADCGKGAHFGYGYLDDICLSCAGNPEGYAEIEVKGDSCLPATITGLYDPPSLNGVDGVLTGITVSITQNGTDVIDDLVVVNINANDETFWFLVTDDNILDNFNGCYEVIVTAHFTLNGQDVDAVSLPVTVCDDCCDDHKIEFIDIECKWVNGQQIYNYELIVHDAQDCGGFIATTNGNNPHLYGFSYVNGDLIITGSVSGLNNSIGICIYIDFEKDQCCDLRVCAKKPKCCEKSPSIKMVRLQCRTDNNGNNYYAFLVEVGNPNGWANPFTLDADCGDVNFNPPWFSGNFMYVSGTITNPSAVPGEECCLTFDFEDSRLCDTKVCFELPCCSNYAEFTDVECVWRNGQQMYEYELIVYNVQDCGKFIVSSNGNNPHNYNYNYSNGNLIMTGTVGGISNVKQLCIEIDFIKEDCCDIKLCINRPPCCIKSPRITMERIICKLDKNGDNYYEFNIQVGNPNGWANPFAMTVDCGDISYNPPTFSGNFMYVTGTITNPTAQPDEECCISFDFDDPRLCDGDVCFKLPHCNCVTNVAVKYPDCIEPGKEYCITYNFDYYGTPQNGVSATWFIAPNQSSPGWTFNSGQNQPVVNYGANSWVICMTYNGNCEQDIDLMVVAVMFDEYGAQCCTLEDVQELSCCCNKEIEIVYCSDDDQQLQQAFNFLKRQPVGKRDNRIDKFLRDYENDVRKRGDGDSCCFLCEYGLGPLWVIDENNQLKDPPYSFLWSTNETEEVILGVPNTTYSVTVIDQNDGCVYTASVFTYCPEKLCGEKGEGGEGEREGFNAHSDNSHYKLNDATIEVYPIPTHGILNVKSNLLTEGSSLRIVDLFNRTVLVKHDLESIQTNIDLGQIPQGTYLLQITDHNGIISGVRRIVVLK